MECIWRHSSHVPPLVKNNFMNPPVSRERLECAIQQRLRFRNSGIIINFDIYGYSFGVDKSILLENQFRELPSKFTSTTY